jgi:hypothetical protein
LARSRGDYCQDAETVTSELVTNAITHANGATIGLEVMRLEASRAVSVIVADASPDPPIMRSPATDLEHWRGLHIIEALSAHWGWPPTTREKPSTRSSPERHSSMEAISELPMLHDMDADYSPQYVKLARIVRDKIQADEYKYRSSLPAAGLASEYGVSVRVAWAALAMLAANRYVSRSDRFSPYG